MGQERERLQESKSRTHVRCDCKYRVVFIPMHRRQEIYETLSRKKGTILSDSTDQSEIAMLEGQAMVNHLHLLLNRRPKYSVSHTVGFPKGKSAARIEQKLSQVCRMTGLHYRTTGDWLT